MKFSVRDLFLVTVIVSLVLGWGLDHYRSSLTAQRANRAEQISTTLEEVLRDNGWDVEFTNRNVSGYKVRYPSDPATTFCVPISGAPAPNAPKK
ncbi:MAG: hypothetical protein ACKVP0_05355 [Pirellulaceae bacterium]